MEMSTKGLLDPSARVIRHSWHVRERRKTHKDAQGVLRGRNLGKPMQDPFDGDCVPYTRDREELKEVREVWRDLWRV